MGNSWTEADKNVLSLVTSVTFAFLRMITMREFQTHSSPHSQGLTSVTHGAEDAFGDTHDGVCGLVITADGLAAAGELPHMLQEVVQGLADHTGCCADLLQEFTVTGGRLAGADTVLHRAVHELPRLDQLLLAHRGADGGAHDLEQDRSGAWLLS